MVAIGVSVPLRFLREALQKGLSQARTKLESTLPKHPTPTSASSASKLQPAYAHAHSQSTLHSRIKVARRWYTTAYRTILHNACINPSGPTPTAPAGRIAGEMSKMTKTTPFATTLRPRLASGAFPRTASGYTLGGGGGARFFSHGPASPAEVVTQVAQAFRAMAQGGKNAADELQKYRNMKQKVSVLTYLAALLTQNQTATRAYVDFHMAPTFTALGGLTRNTIGNAGFMAALDEDFTEIVNDVAAVWSDLLRLAGLGDLPVGLANDREDTIRVYFEGCDGDVVRRLCDDVGVTRGVIGEEKGFAHDLLVPLLDLRPYLENENLMVERLRVLDAEAPVPSMGGRMEYLLDHRDMLSEEQEGEITDMSIISEDGDVLTQGTPDVSPLASFNGYFFEGSSVSGLSPLFSDTQGDEEAVGMMFPPYQPPPQPPSQQLPQHQQLPQIREHEMVQVPVGPEVDVDMEGLQRWMEQLDGWERGERIIVEVREREELRRE